MGLTFGRYIIVFCCLLTPVGFSFGGEIKSGNFSLAFGADSPSKPTWTSLENEATNTPPGENFTLDVHLDGTALSHTGPSFQDRTLGAVSGSGVCGLVSDFLVTVRAQYDGSPPKDAANPPNYRIQINITSVSIFAAVISNADGSVSSFYLNFNEVTSGHEQSQKEQPLEFMTGAFYKATNYTQISWAPKNYPSAVGAIGQEQERLFSLTESTHNLTAIDGFEITGNIVVTYDTKR